MIAFASMCLLGHLWQSGTSAIEPDRYAFDANGRAARVDETWELRRAGAQTLDLFVGLARCGTDVFLSDDQRVYQLDLTSKGPLKVLADADVGIGKPSALAADCEGGKLYLVDAGPRMVVILNTRSGAVLNRHAYRRDLITPRSVNRVESDVLYIGGLWNPEPTRGLPTFPAESFFDSLWIGEKVSLTSGTVEGAIRPYETRCMAAFACTYADLDRIHSPSAPATWVASQGISTRIALYDAQGIRTHTYDIRSPKFVRDGTELSMNPSAEPMERWRSRNSVIRRVYSVNDYLVTIHTLTEMGPDWKSGQPSRFQVFMNVHSLDGKGLVSDIRLPDIPIGRDETHLYAIDYGSTGKQAGLPSVKLVRIPIKSGAESVSQ